VIIAGVLDDRQQWLDPCPQFGLFDLGRGRSHVAGRPCWRQRVLSWLARTEGHPVTGFAGQLMHNRFDRLINTSHQVFMNGPSYRPNKRPRGVADDKKITE
jgi:hypothetical protein